MIAVMNTAFGEPRDENLPFDVRHLRWPIPYRLELTDSENKSAVFNRLVADFVDALRLSLQSLELAAEEAFLPHPPTTDPSSFFTKAEELVPEGPFGQTIQISTVPNSGRAYLRLFPSKSVPAIASELDVKNLISRGLRPMGKNYRSWGFSRNAFGAIAYSTPVDGALYHLTQIFLTLEIWGIDALSVNAEKCKAEDDVRGFIASAYVERMYLEALLNYLRFAEQFLSLPLPLRIEAGLVNVQGYPITVGQSFRGKILENSIVWQADIASFDALPEDILRPFFEHVWAKCGVPRPNDFDAVVKRYFGELTDN